MNYMKKIFNIFCALCLALGLWSCSSDHVSDLRLSGDCMVEALTLDAYEGNIDLTSRSIVVRLPEVYETSSMTVSKLTLSEGATCNVKQGETLDMDNAKSLIVRNGDVSLEWTLYVMHDEARIYSFVINDIYTGSIDESKKTITVYLPGGMDLSNLVPTISYSANATISPATGVAQDFTHPVKYKVTNNSAESEYTVTVISIDKPYALFLGTAPTMDDLDPEAKAACQWMLGNVPKTLYASFADLRAGTIDLSECKVMWWHFHYDGGVDGHDQFVLKAPEAMNTLNELRSFYENGGSFFFTRYATNVPSFIGVTGDDEWTTPNNCWGQNEFEAETCGGPWEFQMYAGQQGHPLWQGIIAGDDPNRVYCTDAGYHITNSTAQYHIGADWGGYDNHGAWEARTGGTILGVGGDGAVVAWEYPAHDGKGHVICIGSGCYDWFSYTYEPGYNEKFHKNIEIITSNAFNILTK